MRSVAINVGANTNAPGFRGPIFHDGDFEFIPIPETEPTTETVPTYGDLDPYLQSAVPADIMDIPVHLDPEFQEYPFGQAYTYGDPYAVKAAPLAELETGDVVFFYATLSTESGDPPDWQAPDWGAYLIGQFRLASDPVTDLDTLEESSQAAFATNAHLKRTEMDAAVLLSGEATGSRMYDRAVPLSAPETGADANRLVIDLSDDSGKGPWWRRPLRFDKSATAELLRVVGDRGW